METAIFHLCKLLFIYLFRTFNYILLNNQFYWIATVMSIKYTRLFLSKSNSGAYASYANYT